MNATAAANALRRLHRSESATMDTHVSVSDIAEVSAAKITSRKNRNPTSTATSPMRLKMSGRMTNMSDGPDFAATASLDPIAANAVGTITKPAKKAKPASNSSMRRTDCSKLSFLPRYEP